MDPLMDPLICQPSKVLLPVKISSAQHQQTSLLMAQLYGVISAFRQPIQQPCLLAHDSRHP